MASGRTAGHQPGPFPPAGRLPGTRRGHHRHLCCPAVRAGFGHGAGQGRPPVPAGHPAAARFRSVPPLLASLQGDHPVRSAGDGGSGHRRGVHRPDESGRRSGGRRTCAGHTAAGAHPGRNRAELLDRGGPQQADRQDGQRSGQAARHHGHPPRGSADTDLAPTLPPHQRHRPQDRRTTAETGRADHCPAGRLRHGLAGGTLRHANRPVAARCRLGA